MDKKVLELIKQYGGPHICEYYASPYLAYTYMEKKFAYAYMERRDNEYRRNAAPNNWLKMHGYPMRRKRRV